MRIHPVFHIRLLEPVTSSTPIPGHIRPEPPPIDIEGQEEWEVKEIVDSRHYRNQLQYLVHWTGYHENTWQPWFDLTHTSDLIQRFHIRNPQKPSPHPDMLSQELEP